MISDAPRAVYRYNAVEHQAPTHLVALTKAYFEAEAQEYDQFDAEVRRRSSYLTAVDAHSARVLSDLVECETIVSFGCGTGRREVAITNLAEIDATVVGIEHAPTMAGMASARGLVVHPGLPEMHAAVPEASVDAALCLYSFIHLPTEDLRLEVLRGLARVLKEGAPLVIDVFNLHDKYEWSSKIEDGCLGTPPPMSGPHRGDVLYRRAGRVAASYMHYFTLAELCSLLELAGFVITEVVGVGHGRHPGVVGVPLDEGCLLVIARRAAG